MLKFTLLLVLLCVCFPTEGQARSMIEPVFQTYYQSHGGLAVFGLPLSGGQTKDGYLVQYFERERFEYHPELGLNNVLLGRLGAELVSIMDIPGDLPAATSSGYYFAPTHQSIATIFDAYWQKNGGLSLFGYPISTAYDNAGTIVQWFERARFEYHAENTAPYNILLGRLGVEWQNWQVVLQPATDLEQQLSTNLNEQRQVQQEPMVKLNPALSAIARSRSAQMVRNHYFSHYYLGNMQFSQLLLQYNFTYTDAGEIIHRNNIEDREQSISQAVTSFMQSPQHRAIITTAKYTLCGVGVARDDQGFYYYTVIYLQP